LSTNFPCLPPTGFVKVEFTVFEMRKASRCHGSAHAFDAYTDLIFLCSQDFSFVILGPLKLQPRPFDKVGRISNGQMTLRMTDLICESKGGSVGAEGA
jgi:hypothetical protein